MKYNLLDNSYAFINESIANARRSKSSPRYWSFAILHLIQGLELLLKQVLKNEHPVLIYENIDKQRNTVSLSQALERLINISGIDIEEQEKKIINRAVQQRNKIVHHEYNVNELHMKSIYLQLFEFVHYFHFKHISLELHDFINKKMWRTEAELLSEFRENMVVYRGQELPKDYPLEIVTGQKYNGMRIGVKGNYKFYKRYIYGNDPFSDSKNEDIQKVCDDCGVEIGEIHVSYCDLETCPICCEQLLSCTCQKEFWIVTDESKFEPRQIEKEKEVQSARALYFKNTFGEA